MASKYDWEFIQPLNQAANIAALSQGNQQINAGLQGIGNAVTGYADAMKQRNTDEILNALTSAKTSAELPNALNAVQALQQQYGRGYDQTEVRNAIDTRGTTLGQRDIQAINLQQAQAAQAAITQLNQAYAAEAIRMGANPNQVNALAALGINASSDLNRFGTNAQGDLRYAAEGNERRGNRAEDVAYRNQQAQLAQQNWDKSFGLQQQGAAIQAANYLAPKAGETTSFIDANGNVVTSAQPSRAQALLGATDLMSSIISAESGGRHVQSNGQLTRSPKGALGIAQIMPATAAKPGYGMPPINLQNTTPEQQVQWASQYINRIGKAHNFTTEQAVAAYNAGPGAVQKAINSGGANWLSKLPKETRDYVPKVLGGVSAGTGTAAQANQAVAGITPANLATVKGGYNESINKLNATFNSDMAKAQTKGSLASTGKSVDTWAASKKDSGLVFAGNNSFFTSASDLAKLAKADKTFNQLPQAAQMNILEGAYAKLNDVNALQYVKDSDLKKFINTESKQYSIDQTNQFEQQKKAAFETAYQALAQNYQAVGAKAPTREVASRLLGITQPSKPQAKPDAAVPKTSKAPSTAQSTDAFIPYRNTGSKLLSASDLEEVLKKYR